MKSNRELKLEQFYTNPKLAKKLISNLNINEYKVIIEPSAGNGSFSLQMPNCIAYDISPKHNSIIEKDFLKLDIETEPKRTLIIGNPPFGRQSSLAIKFLKKSCFLADTVAFILPRSFKKDSMRDKVPLTHKCVFEEDLNEIAFMSEWGDYLVKCVFQIWKKSKRLRKKSLIFCTDYFEWCKIDEAELYIIRVGGKAGKIGRNIEDKSIKSNYFIKHKKMPIEEIYKIFDSIFWKHNNTTGPKSISKNEFVKAFLKQVKIFEKI